MLGLFQAEISSEAASTCKDLGGYHRVQFNDSYVVDVGRKSEHAIQNPFDFDFDLVFTSPPFFCTGTDWASSEGYRDDQLIEVYHGCETSCEKFMAESLIPVARFCLQARPASWLCFHLPKGMKEILEQEIGPCRMELPFKTAGFENVVYCWNAEFGHAARRLKRAAADLLKIDKVAADLKRLATKRKLGCEALRIKRPRRCQTCGEIGHFAKTCTK
eukprot:TRINITY_DN60877_c0_g1_i1.p1 TRINITY_DN60877_c0_g1~~TRINITY_DN60877_c0_g1_i1.p1  ORF type:complete len:243 (+),score=20.66 TRINITY_DN60877_c0_g1_i1:79-729(+)